MWSGPEILEEILFWEPIKLTTKEIDIFNHIKSFFQKHKMSIDVIDSICFDDAPAMLGKNSGFVSCVKKRIAVNYNNSLYVR